MYSHFKHKGPKQKFHHRQRVRILIASQMLIRQIAKIFIQFQTTETIQDILLAPSTFSIGGEEGLTLYNSDIRSLTQKKTSTECN